jgi:hypothetical protein
VDLGAATASFTATGPKPLRLLSDPYSASSSMGSRRWGALPLLHRRRQAGCEEEKRWEARPCGGSRRHRHPKPVGAARSQPSVVAHPHPLLEARLLLPSAGRMGSACAAPFLGHVGGVAENGWPEWIISWRRFG